MNNQQVAISFAEIHDVSEIGFEQLLLHIPKRQREGILKFKFKKDALASLYGKLLLKEMLCRVFGSTIGLEHIKYTNYNRPHIGHNQTDFNISHSAKYVVCALGRGAKVGIDIEMRQPIQLSEFKSVFSDFEWAFINESKNHLDTFYSVWTQKEAAVKANGKGLSIPPHEVLIQNATAKVENEYWYLSEVAIAEGYSCHLATDVQLVVSPSVQQMNFL